MVLARARSPEAQQCLQKALWTSTSSTAAAKVEAAKDPTAGVVGHERLSKALRHAALLGCGRDRLGLELDAPHPSADRLRQGAWVLFEALQRPATARTTCAKDVAATLAAAKAVDPSFLIFCWRDLWERIESSTNDSSESISKVMEGGPCMPCMSCIFCKFTTLTKYLGELSD